MIGIGLIGFGYWGPNLARCFSETDGSTLVAISDPDPAALARAGRRFPHARLLPDPSDLIADPKVDAVAVATPVATHFDLAMAAMQAGKHIFVEKPLTASSDHAQRLVDEAARRRLTLMVGHVFVYSPAVQKIRELMASGEIGDIFYYDSVRINLGLMQRDVSVLWDLAVHDLSILQSLLRERPTCIAASGICPLRRTVESMAYVTLSYAGGTVAHISVSWLSPVKVRRTLIGGSRKMIVFDDLEPSEKIKVYDRGVSVPGEDHDAMTALRIGYRLGDTWAPHLSSAEALKLEAEHFLNAIGTGTPPLTDGESGLRVVELLEAASWSMHRRGQPVDLQPQRRAS